GAGGEQPERTRFPRACVEKRCSAVARGGSQEQGGSGSRPESVGSDGSSSQRRRNGVSALAYARAASRPNLELASAASCASAGKIVLTASTRRTSSTSGRPPTFIFTIV